MNKQVEPAEPVHMNIYKSKTFRTDLSWLHFNNELRVQERYQKEDQQYCIFTFVAYSTILLSN